MRALEGPLRSGRVGALRCVWVICTSCRARVTVPAEPNVTLSDLRVRLQAAMDDHVDHFHFDEVA